MARSKFNADVIREVNNISLFYADKITESRGILRFYNSKGDQFRKVKKEMVLWRLEYRDLQEIIDRMQKRYNARARLSIITKEGGIFGFSSFDGTREYQSRKADIKKCLQNASIVTMSFTCWPKNDSIDFKINPNTLDTIVSV